MKSLLPTCCICALSLVLSSCVSVSVPDIRRGLSTLDFDIDSSSYVVRAGETLETIAFRYDTSVSALQQLNPDAARGVYAGMRLNIRQPIARNANSRNTPTITRNAAWSESSARNDRRTAAWSVRDEQQNVPVVRTTPAPTRQAVPIVARASDSYLLGGERLDGGASQFPAIIEKTPQAFTQQRGYPVEEIIDDDNFVLPNSRAGVEEELQKFIGGWQWPLNGKLAREYDPLRPNGRGIEIVGLPGQEVYATRDGVVDWVARSPDGVGKVVIVRHDDDYLSIYSNAQDLFVSMKDSVKQGDPIASLGANANDEPLLRFEISKGGNLLNPIDFLSPR